MEINSNLDFSGHVSNVYKKINDQLDVMMRFNSEPYTKGHHS